MSHDPESDDERGASGRTAAHKAAFDRRAAALKANLKRRKAQLRGRAADVAEKPDPSGDEPA